MGIGGAATAVLFLAAGLPAYAQVVISARAGLIHHVEGRAFLNHETLPRQFGRFPRIKENDLFRTGKGMAEILLSPGVFLRLGPGTSIRLLSDEITNAWIELISGEVVVEAVNLRQVGGVSLKLEEFDISTNKKGQYHLTANPPWLRVFSGSATAASSGRRLEVKKGREILMDGVLTDRPFNSSDRNGLDYWSELRSQLLAESNAALLMKEAAESPLEFGGADRQISDLDAAERMTRSVRIGARGTRR
jgi:hypothetical protein